MLCSEACEAVADFHGPFQKQGVGLGHGTVHHACRRGPWSASYLRDAPGTVLALAGSATLSLQPHQEETGCRQVLGTHVELGNTASRQQPDSRSARMHGTATSRHHHPSDRGSKQPRPHREASSSGIHADKNQASTRRSQHTLPSHRTAHAGRRCEDHRPGRVAGSEAAGPQASPPPQQASKSATRPHATGRPGPTAQ